MTLTQAQRRDHTNAKAHDFDETTLIGSISRGLRGRREIAYEFTAQSGVTILEGRLLAALNLLDAAEWAMRRLINNTALEAINSTAEAQVCDEVALVVADIRRMKQCHVEGLAKLKGDHS